MPWNIRAAERRCPPEDVGGRRVTGLLEALAPTPSMEEQKTCSGGVGVRPEAFDLDT